MALQSGNDVALFQPPSSIDALRRALRNIFTRQESTKRSESEPSNYDLQRAKDYWDSIESEKRKSFLEISISDLRQYFLNSKHCKYEDLTNDLSYVYEHKVSKILSCCECSYEFFSPDLFLKHVKRYHIKCQLPDLPDAPHIKKVDKAMVEMIISGDWEPLPTEAEGEPHLHSASENIFNGTCEDLSSLQGQEIEHLSPVQKKAYQLKILQQKFRRLSENGCLAYNHLMKVLKIIEVELVLQSSSLNISSEELSLLPRKICSLESDQLDRISAFFEELENSCKDEDDLLCPPKETMAEQMLLPIEKILTLDPTMLRLNKSFFVAEHLWKSLCDLDESGIDDAIFSSIISGYNILDSIAAQKVEHGKILLQMMDEKYDQLRSDLKESCNLSTYKRTINNVFKSLNEETRKRNTPEYSIVSFKSIISKTVRESALAPPNKLEFLYDICKEAHGYLSGRTASYENMLTEWDSLDIYDHIIIRTLKRIEDGVFLKVCKNDARILRSWTSLYLYESTLKGVSTYDVPLSFVYYMKIFMRSQLEDMAEKHATQKASAAREPLLNEEARDCDMTPRRMYSHPKCQSPLSQPDPTSSLTDNEYMTADEEREGSNSESHSSPQQS